MSKAEPKEKKEKNWLEDIKKDIEETFLESTPEKVKIIFKDTERKPLIIRKPKEAYWWGEKFKYKKRRKEHWIDEDIIAELEIIHKNKKEVKNNVKSKR